jgi:selenocysteine-specific elongation factor
MRSVARLDFLRQCAQSIDDPSNVLAANIQRMGIAARDGLLVQSNFSAAAIDAAISSDPNLLVRGGSVLTQSRWDELLDRCASIIQSHHRDHPEQAGLTLSALRPIAGPLLDAAIDALTSRGFVRSQTVIRSHSHRPALPPRLQPAGSRLRLILEKNPLDPPPRSELTPDAISQQAMTFLKINGEVIELSPTVFITTAAFECARQMVQDFLKQRGRATVSELKDAMHTSRRVAVPLLEKLDQTGVTRRDGDLRRLRE